MRNWLAAAGAAILVLAVIGPGCNGGGASGELQATFVADRTAPDVLDVHLSKGFTAGALVGVLVNVTGISGLQEARFTIEYRRSIARFSSFAAGEAFETGGAIVTYSVVEGPPGRVHVDIVRDPASGPIDVDLTATVVRLNFRLMDAGATRVDFVSPSSETRELFDSAGDPIPGVSWFGGSLKDI